MAVYKSNELIQYPYDISLAAQRVIYNCLENIPQAMAINPNTIFEIDPNIYALANNITLKRAYIDIKQAALDLKHCDIELPNNEIVNDATSNISWVSEVIYKDKGYFLAIRWHPKVIPHISGFLLGYTSEGKPIWRGNTTKLQQKICQQQSTDVIRLYELFKMIEWKGKWDVSLEELRILMRIDANYYSLYGDFKKRILDKGIAKIIELTDMRVSYKEVKYGKKVTGFTFIFEIKHREKVIVESIMEHRIEFNRDRGNDGRII